MSKRDEPKKPGKYGVDMGDRGIYDTRNPLNDLTGKEWLFFTNSVWITGFSPTAKENVGLKYRKIHPSPKPPALMCDIIKFFTKSDGKILDPFCGVGGTLLGAALAGGTRTAVGIELEQKYIDAYNKVCEKEGIEKKMIDYLFILIVLRPVCVNHKYISFLSLHIYYNTSLDNCQLIFEKKLTYHKKYYGRLNQTSYSFAHIFLNRLEAAFLCSSETFLVTVLMLTYFLGKVNLYE